MFAVNAQERTHNPLPNARAGALVGNLDSDLVARSRRRYRRARR
ncbi:MAG: hypothetical protein AAGF15_10400 [Pseudomonadota bacterium]